MEDSVVSLLSIFFNWIDSTATLGSVSSTSIFIIISPVWCKDSNSTIYISIQKYKAKQIINVKNHANVFGYVSGIVA